MRSFTRAFAALVMLVAGAGCGGGGGGGSGGTITVQTSPLAIVTTTLADGTAGTHYSAILTGTNGSLQSYTWTVSAGALPPGLAINPTGTPSTAIAGTPTAAGAYRFTLTLTDSRGATASRGFAITIFAQLSISTTTLPPAIAGSGYAERITATGGSGAGYTWDLAAGSLPATLALAVGGTPDTMLAGTPAAPGKTSFTVRVTDSLGATATQALSLTVNPPLSIVTTTVPDATKGTSYLATMTATGGSGSGYRWTRHAGALPPGITFQTTGTPSTQVWGTPTAEGSYGVTVRVTDDAGAVATQVFAFHVNAQLVVTAPTATKLPLAVQTVPYSASVTAGGGTNAGYTWDVVGGLPAGLHIAATGTPATTIDGTPSVSGAGFGFTVRVTDPNGAQATKSYTLDVNPPVAITQPAAGPLAHAAKGIAYAATIRAALGSTAGYTWAITAGALPDGLAIGASGTPTTQITGAPTNTGTFNFTVTVTDSLGTTDSESYSITVDDPLSIYTHGLVAATVNAAYGQQLAATGGAGGNAWALASGAPPGGLTLSAAGLLSGTPTQTGVFFFTVSVTDAQQFSDTQPLVLEVKGPDRWLAYAADQRADTVREVFVVDTSAASPSAEPALASWPADGDVPTSASYQKFSPDGTKFAFRMDRTGSDELYMIDLAGPLPLQAVRVNPQPATTTADVTEFAWSPDSRLLLYRADQDTDALYELYVVEAANPGVSYKVTGTLLGSSGTWSSQDKWGFSPDGKKVAYLGDQTIDQVYEVWVTDVSTLPPAPTVKVNAPLPSATSTNDIDEMFWLNRDVLIYWGKQFEVGVDDLVAVDLSQLPAVSQPQRVNPHAVTNGDTLSTKYAASPDGTRVAFVGDLDTDARDELFLVELAGATPLATYKLNPPYTGTFESVTDFRWSPDGAKIAYVADQNASGLMELYVVDVGGAFPGGPVRVSDPTVTTANDLGTSKTGFVFSPDSKLVAYKDTASTVNLFLVDLTQAAPAPELVSVRAGTGDDVIGFAFSPDGGRLAYTGDLDAVNDENEVYFVELIAGTAGAQLQLNQPLPLNGDVDTTDFFWSRDGSRIYFRGDAATDNLLEVFMVDLATGTQTKLSGVMAGTPTTGGDADRLTVQD